MTAALFPGAAVFAQAPAEVVCIGVASDSMTQAVEASSLIAIARVETVQPGVSASLVPEALLKGSTSSRTIDLTYPQQPPASGCKLATLEPGSRIFVFLAGSDGRVGWPGEYQVFVLNGLMGRAVQQGDTGWREVTEAGLTTLVRNLTGQYFVPVAENETGAGIDWGSTIIPVGFAVLALFGVGLIFMRQWHKIDPS